MFRLDMSFLLISTTYQPENHRKPMKLLSSKRKNVKSHRSEEQREAPQTMKLFRLFLEIKGREKRGLIPKTSEGKDWKHENEFTPNPKLLFGKTLFYLFLRSLERHRNQKTEVVCAGTLHLERSCIVRTWNWPLQHITSQPLSFACPPCRPSQVYSVVVLRPWLGSAQRQ